jgi:hypothetical protein
MKKRKYKEIKKPKIGHFSSRKSLRITKWREKPKRPKSKRLTRRPSKNGKKMKNAKRKKRNNITIYFKKSMKLQGSPKSRKTSEKRQN